MAAAALVTSPLALPAHPYAAQLDEWTQDAAILPALKRAQLSCVFVDSPDEIGSGVVLDSTGLVLTAGHCVGSMESGETRIVEDVFGHKFTAITAHLSSHYDLALLQLQPTPNQPFPAATAALASTPLRKHDACVVIGQPLMHRKSRRKGDQRQRVEFGKIVSTPLDPLQREDDQRGNLMHTANTTAGHSGSPLLNMRGEIAGIHVTCDDHQQSAVTLEAIQQFIAQSKKRSA